ncbi:MAG: VanZ family protein [Sarcina sp.]
MKRIGTQKKLVKQISNKKKFDKKKIFNIIFLVGWVVFIFFMSSKNAEASTQDSDFVVNIFNSVGLDLTSNFGEFATVIVRKGAHFTEYMILSFFIYRVVNDYVPIRKKAMLYTILAVCLCACSDELYQVFVPGRAGRATDVLIDTLGGSLYIAIVHFKYRFRYRNLKVVK